MDTSKMWRDRKYSLLHLAAAVLLGIVVGGFLGSRSSSDCSYSQIMPYVQPETNNFRTGDALGKSSPSGYAPYYIPAPVKYLPYSEKVGASIPSEFWKNNPSMYWAAPQEQLISKSDEAKCREAINWQNRKDPENGGYHGSAWSLLNMIALSPRCYQYWRYMPTVHQYLNLVGSGMSNFGQDPYSSGLMFSGMDRIFMDFIMLTVPKAKTIVEFGTAAGVTSVYLGVSAKMRGGRLHTFDINDFRHDVAKAVWNDDYMVRYYEDILEAKDLCRPFLCVAVNKNAISVVASSDIWLIDNGVKDKETYLYAEHAPIGCVAIVHDMTLDPAQFNLFDQSFQYHGWVSVYKDFAESIGTHLRAWKRIRRVATPETLASLKEPNQVHPAKGGLM